MRDYYEILQVHPKASAEVIKKAFLVLAKQYHPDTCTLPKYLAEQKMKELNEAYNVLCNPTTREKFDREYAVYTASKKQQETYEAMKAATDAANKRAQEEAEKVYKQEIQKRRDNINDTCLSYIDRIRKYIINDNTSTDQLQRAVALLNIFYQETSADYKFLFDEEELDSYTSETYGSTLLWFASAFIQYGDAKNANGVITYAERFIPSSSANYQSLISLKNQALQSCAVNTTTYEQTNNNNKMPDSKETSSHSMDFAAIKILLMFVIGLVLICGIGTFAFSGVSKTNDSKTTNIAKQYQQQSKGQEALAEYIKTHSLALNKAVEEKYRPTGLDTNRWIAIGAYDNKDNPDQCFVQYYSKDSIKRINDSRLPGKQQIAYDTLIVLPNDKNFYYYIQHQVFCYNDANKIGAVALNESQHKKDGKVIKTMDINPDRVRMTEDECNNSMLSTLRKAALDYIK